MSEPTVLAEVNLTSETRVSVREVRRGHRLVDARTLGKPIQTRDIRPLWVLPVIAPLEIAARWRARLEGRYG